MPVVRFIGRLRFRYLLPLAFLIGGRFVPYLQEPVFSGRFSVPLLASILASVIILGAWIYIEAMVVNDRRTSTSDLIHEDHSSLVVSTICTVVFGFFAGCEVLTLIARFTDLKAPGLDAWPMPWWVPVAWLAAYIDASISGKVAINNAAQKVPFEGLR